MTLREALVAEAEPDRIEGMEAYMKGHFRYLGVRSPNRKRAQREFLADLRKAEAGVVMQAAEGLWDEPEREFHYVACDLLRRHAKRLPFTMLPRVRALIQRHSWWDSVDVLASRVVGPMVRGRAEEMERWIADDDLWVARTALLHQLNYGADIDAERLFRFCTLQAEHRDFFIRKAIGWALRQHAKTDPEAVRGYVARTELSGLSRREALKHLEP